MTLQYKLLKIPKTIKELIDKGKRKGAKEAEIILKDYSQIGLGDIYVYECSVLVKINNDEVNVSNHSYKTRESSVKDYIMEVANALQKATEDAVRIKKELEENNLEAEIKKELVAETFDAFENSYEIIEKIRNVLKEAISYEIRGLN